METTPLLVVDDEPHIRILIREALEAPGREVDTADGGRAALDRLRAQPYALMLLDLRMPDLDGFAVLEQAWTIRPAMRIVVMTAHGTVDDAVEAMKLGAVDFLRKPFEPAALRQAVADALEDRTRAGEEEDAFLALMRRGVLRHLRAPAASEKPGESGSHPLGLTTDVILVDGSREQVQLLNLLGIEPSLVTQTDGLPAMGETSPVDSVRSAVRQRVTPVAVRHPEALTVCAHTTIAVHGECIGRPADAGEARRLLRRLSGATHTVHTGLALAHHASGRLAVTHEATQVTFGPLRDRDIEAYVATRLPLRHVGGYHLHDDYGVLFVERISGEHHNAAGMPLRRLYRTLRSDFENLLAIS